MAYPPYHLVIFIAILPNAVSKISMATFGRVVCLFTKGIKWDSVSFYARNDIFITLFLWWEFLFDGNEPSKKTLMIHSWMRFTFILSM